VPVLWDEVEHTIVSNESADIIRMFNSAFDELGASVGDYYPPAHRREIDAINERVLEKIMSNQYAVPLSPRGLSSIAPPPRGTIPAISRRSVLLVDRS
jgi:putative glutathione S-transferase